MRSPRLSDQTPTATTSQGKLLMFALTGAAVVVATVGVAATAQAGSDPLPASGEAPESSAPSGAVPSAPPLPSSMQSATSAPAARSGARAATMANEVARAKAAAQPVSGPAAPQAQ